MELSRVFLSDCHCVTDHSCHAVSATDLSVTAAIRALSAQRRVGVLFCASSKGTAVLVSTVK